MNLITFLKKSIAGKLSQEFQINFLGVKRDITSQELASVVRFLQKQITHKPHLEDAIDVCGTGGSGLSRINTSTISAFILASLGVGVAKHGNRAASGRFGSFDLIESLGIKFTDDIFEIEKKYKREKLALLFAPFFYPVMKHFAEVRKKIGKPTFFNLLGPLLNPASPKRQIIGTTFKDKMRLIANTCRLLGKEKIYVVCGEDGLDEVTLTGRTFVTELSNRKIRSYTITPEDFCIPRASFTEIEGGNAAFNIQIARDILASRCKTRHLDLVLVNTALALKLVDQVKTLKDGYGIALCAINTPSILLKIVAHKRLEIEKQKNKNPIKNVAPSIRNFTAAIKGKGLSIIAEVKKSSPSEGIIHEQQFSPTVIAKKYEKSGANAISVLCDQKFFGGDLNHLKEVAKNTLKTPLLCKDFIIDEYQIYEARKYGADAILLITSILNEKQIHRFIEVAKSLKMDAVCEVHTLEELKKVLKTSAKIIGINNRNLHTFKTDISTTLKLVKYIPRGKLIVSESGFFSKEDVSQIQDKVDAILVGSALMKGRRISDLIGRKLKICGVRDIKVARFCEKLGVDFIGLNFVPKSKRFVTVKKAQAICQAVKKTAKVGVFQNQPLVKVNHIARKLDLDYVQLSGNESISFVKKCCRPVIKTISIKKNEDLEKAEKYLPYSAYILLDSAFPGSGIKIKVNLKNIDYPFLLAGGISPSNITNVVRDLNPIGVDVASGIETDSKIDLKKVTLLLNQLKSC